jgi:hypothetical protein
MATLDQTDDMAMHRQSVITLRSACQDFCI